METCAQQTRRGRCARRPLNPRSRCWRLLALHRPLGPLLPLCDQHAERRVLLSFRPAGETGLKGRRRELYGFLWAQPPGVWATAEEMALAIYGDRGPLEVAAVRNLVHRIRLVDRTLIETLNGIGYRLSARQARAGHHTEEGHHERAS